MNRYFLFFIALLFYNFSVAQSIVNTEKLFIDNDDGFAVSAELMGSSIQGNADVLLVEYSLNFAYKKAKNSFKLLSGGEYINESKQVISMVLCSYPLLVQSPIRSHQVPCNDRLRQVLKRKASRALQTKAG